MRDPCVCPVYEIPNLVQNQDMARRLLAVIGGIVIGVLLIGITQSLFHALMPPPAGLDASDPESMAAYVATLPVWQLGLILVSYVVGAFGGGFAGGRLTEDEPQVIGLIIGGGLTIFTLMTLLQITHPVWFWFPALLIHIPGARLGAIYGSK